MQAEGVRGAGGERGPGERSQKALQVLNEAWTQSFEQWGTIEDCKRDIPFTLAHVFSSAGKGPPHP